MNVEEDVLTAALNSLGEFIVIVDEDGIITMMTDGYKKFLRCEHPEGNHVTKVIPNTRLHIVAKNSVKEVGDIQEVNNHKMVSMRVPLIIDGKIRGAIGRVMFRDIHNLNSLTNKVNVAERNREPYQNKFTFGNRATTTFDKLIGKSEKFLEVIHFAERVAKGSSSILITGDSGTGKELLAEAIHNESSRSKGPFVKINCGAIPPELFESEMFGYDGGAFTGAKKTGQKGKFEVANGGTILLDEIGDMPLFMQVKLLRVIQEREVVRVGSNEVKKIDVRIIAATNKNLSKLIDEGKFREDLYYRLNVLNIKIPSLHERKDDIRILAESLRKKICLKYGIYSEGIREDALICLENYNWPGNVRELENVIERAVNLLNDDIEITPEHLPSKITNNEIPKDKYINGNLSEIVDRVEAQVIIQVLEKTKGNKIEASKILGISRQALYKKINKLRLNDRIV